MSSTMDAMVRHPVMSLFKRITEIPHPSRQEHELAEWVRNQVVAHGWSLTNDKAGNILITVPATAGMEQCPPVCLQAHLDMVCVDDTGKTFGPERYPLALQVDGDWLSAQGTTLGADNGIGLALALAAASHCDHGPIEILCTVEEETGLEGATRLDLPIRSRMLINLDSEDLGIFFVGCAGGMRADITCQYSLSRTDGMKVPGYLITVSGLRGGHSGLEIHKNRGNAIMILSKVLKELRTLGQVQLGNLIGGSRHNAIPVSAKAHIMTDIPIGAILECLGRVHALEKERLEADDPNLKIVCNGEGTPPEVTDSFFTDSVCNLVLGLPNGVITMSPIPDIPETSCNIGVISMENGILTVSLMPRSSDTAALRDIKTKIAAACMLTYDGSRGFTPETAYHNEYPGWQPNLESPLLKKALAAWSAQFGTVPQVTAVHAGLECGILLSKLPGMDALSFGPDIRGAHTIEECVSIPSVDRCYTFLSYLLTLLAR